MRFKRRGFNQIERRLGRGYQRLLKNRHLIALGLQLTDAEFRLWELYFDLFDWDEKHEETYGKLDFTDRQCAEVLGCSPSKICATRKLLVEKGLVVVTDNGYQIKKLSDGSYTSTVKQNDLQNDEDVCRNKQNVSLGEQEQLRFVNSPLVSYKGVIGSSKTEVSNREYYDELVKDKSFTIDDMRWLDRNY